MQHYDDDLVFRFYHANTDTLRLYRNFYENYILTIQIQIPLTDHDLSEITEEIVMKFGT